MKRTYGALAAAAIALAATALFFALAAFVPAQAGQRSGGIKIETTDVGAVRQVRPRVRVYRRPVYVRPAFVPYRYPPYYGGTYPVFPFGPFFSPYYW